MSCLECGLCSALSSESEANTSRIAVLQRPTDRVALVQDAHALLQGMVWEGTPCAQAPLAGPVAHRSGDLGLSPL